MQQCQVNFQPSFLSKVPEKWSPQWGVEPTTSQYEFSALTTRPRLLASNFFNQTLTLKKYICFPEWTSFEYPLGEDVFQVMGWHCWFFNLQVLGFPELFVYSMISHSSTSTHILK
jgi:hypothetical protein